MSFEELAPQIKTAKEPPPVRVRMIQRGEAPARLSVVIRADLLADFGESFRVSLGKAEDLHLLRVAGDKDGLFQPSPLVSKRGANKGGASRFVRFLLPPHGRFPDCSMPSQSVTFERDEKRKCILISLPSWAWDEKRKREVETGGLRKAA